jgi:hypothetical protein
MARSAGFDECCRAARKRRAFTQARSLVAAVAGSGEDLGAGGIVRFRAHRRSPRCHSGRDETLIDLKVADASTPHLSLWAYLLSITGTGEGRRGRYPERVGRRMAVRQETGTRWIAPMQPP